MKRFPLLGWPLAATIFIVSCSEGKQSGPVAEPTDDTDDTNEPSETSSSDRDDNTDEEHSGVSSDGENSNSDAGSSSSNNADAGSDLTPVPAPSDEAIVLPGMRCGDLTCAPFASCDESSDPGSCTCALGFAGDGLRCKDVDECQETPGVCGNGTCYNTTGGYECRCDIGHAWNGSSCEDIDECESNPCDEAATCSNVAGGFTCACGADSVGDGFFCSQDDACADEPCGAGGHCVVTAAPSSGYACQCELGFEGQDACAPCGEHITIPDQGLRSAVNRALGRELDDDSTIPHAVLSGYTSLDASGFRVNDLAGLECWPHLQTLRLSNNETLSTEGIGTLAKLNSLTALYLDCTSVTRLDVLSAHPTLRTLSVNALNCEAETRLEDASAVGTIPRLEVLDLRGHALESAAFLSGAKNLRSLAFAFNQLSSPRELGTLALLRELDLASNRLGDLDGISGMVQLQTLNIAYNNLTDLEPTKQLAHLTFISANDNAITTLPDWSDLMGLREVNVDFNRLTSLVPLAELSELSWVNVGGNQIESLEPLLKGSFRGTLVITGNPLRCKGQAHAIVELRGMGVDVKGNCQP